MLYRVAVEITGVIRVEADNPAEAEKMVRIATPTLQGKKVFGAKVSATCEGEVENVELSPNNVTQFTASKPKLH